MMYFKTSIQPDDTYTVWLCLTVYYFLIDIFHFLSLGRYSSVQCIPQSEKCSTLDLGLLDFGASYTFILIEVRIHPNTF